MFRIGVRCYVAPRPLYGVASRMHTIGNERLRVLVVRAMLVVSRPA